MKRQNRKLLMIGIVLSLIGGACAPPTPSPLDQVKAFQDAYNKRDTEGVLALFADNAYWEFPYYGATDKKAVRNVLEFSFEANSHVELSDCKLENGVITCQARYTGDCYPPEIGPQDLEFRFAEGKILMLSAQAISNIAWHQQRSVWSTYQSRALNWASQNFPADFAKFNTLDLAKFEMTGDLGSSTLSAREFGQLYHRICTGYTEAQ